MKNLFYLYRFQKPLKCLVVEPFPEAWKIILFRIIGVVSAGNLHRWWFSCEETAEEPCMVPSPAPLENEVKHVTRQAAIFDPPQEG